MPPVNALPSPKSPGVSRRYLLQGAAAWLGAAAFAPSLQAQGEGPVLVLGAGLAGLAAALRLQDAGRQVLVLEAAARLGGRIHTLDKLPGRPETGGTQISNGYVRTLALCQRLGLFLEPNARSPLFGDARMVLFVQGRRRSLEQWAAADDNPLPAAVKALPPDRALARLLAPNPLSSVGAWRDPAHSALDIPALGPLRERGVSEAALALLDVNNAFGDTLAQTTLLHLHYTQANLTELLKTPGPVRNVVGGNQRLPEAMAAALRTAPRMNSRVQAVEQDASGVLVHATDGSRHRGSRLVCTLPLPALAAVRFTPALPARLAEAAALAAYAKVTQLHLEVIEPFWEADGSSPFLWSDGPLERVFPQDREGNGRPPTLTAWINGAGTQRWDGLDDATAARLVEAELVRIWPSARGAVRLLHRTAWHQDVLAGGAWINWAPGQISRFSAALGPAVGRLHFAGEHTGRRLRGIEAAVESGERAADEILAA